MPANKKHHYVSRFYLKNFSKTGKSINLYNILGNLTISNASLKQQCCKDYFYGENPKVEKAFSDVECRAALILKKILNTYKLPKFNSEEHQILIFFIILQYGRTRYAAEQINEDTDKLFKYLFAAQIKDIGESPDKFKIGLKKPALEAALFASKVFFYALDLKIKILLNKTPLEFVTCDNPVVFYNQFLEYRKHVSNCGLRTKGLQIYFPLSPEVALILYDKWSYKVGSIINVVVKIDAREDTEELNKLQMVNALENVYFSDENQAHLVERLTRGIIDFRRQEKSIMRHYIREDNRLKELITMSKYDIRIGLCLSFISEKWFARLWRARYKRQKIQQVAIVRNPKYLNKLSKSYNRHN